MILTTIKPFWTKYPSTNFPAGSFLGVFGLGRINSAAYEAHRRKPFTDHILILDAYAWHDPSSSLTFSGPWLYLKHGTYIGAHPNNTLDYSPRDIPTHEVNTHSQMHRALSHEATICAMRKFLGLGLPAPTCDESLLEFNDIVRDLHPSQPDDDTPSHGLDIWALNARLASGSPITPQIP